MILRTLAVTTIVVSMTSCRDATSVDAPDEAHTQAELALAMGNRHTCALDETGTAYCWGANNVGQLGTGQSNTNPNTAPAPVAGNRVFKQIVAGGNATCALTTSGVVYCWGATSLGITAAEPTPVGGPNAVRFTAISMAGHLCGLDSNGQAHCAGDNRFGQLGTGDVIRSDATRPVAGGLRFKAITAGFNTTCGLQMDGKAFCWGWNSFAQLGNGRTEPAVVSPAVVSDNHNFTRLGAGAAVTCGVSQARGTLCWGTDYYGSLGHGLVGDPPGGGLQSSFPARVVGNLTFVSVYPGKENNIYTPTCAITGTGAAYCWGAGSHGQLGTTAAAETCTSQIVPSFNCTAEPVAVMGGLTFAVVLPGAQHTCAITRDRRLYCWGLNDQGQLGTGSTVSSPTPVAVTGGLKVAVARKRDSLQL